jgi:UPF0716 protein FxsA
MNIGRPLLIILAIFPFVEIALLIRLMGAIGFIPTLGLLLISATAGISVIRHQGLSALTRVQQALARGELPAREVANSGIATLGGLLLLIPGILSDILALPCLIPTLRLRLADRLIASRSIMPTSVNRSHEDTVIEGEFRRDD